MGSKFYIKVIFLFVSAIVGTFIVPLFLNPAFAACAWYDVMCNFQKNDTSGSGVNKTATITSNTENPTSTLPSVSSPDVNQQTNNCDASYPDFCIPSPPPDLNCADVPQKRFTVTGSDPHGFDRDGDGIGCES